MPRILRRKKSRRADLAEAIRTFLSDTSLDQFGRFKRSLFVFPRVVGGTPRPNERRYVGIRRGPREVAISEHGQLGWFLARLKATPDETLQPGEMPFSDTPPSLPPFDRGVLLLPSEDPATEAGSRA